MHAVAAPLGRLPNARMVYHRKTIERSELHAPIFMLYSSRLFAEQRRTLSIATYQSDAMSIRLWCEFAPTADDPCD